MDTIKNYEDLYNAIIEDAIAEWRSVMSDDKKGDADVLWGGYGRRLLIAAQNEKYIREHAKNGDDIADVIRGELKGTKLAKATNDIRLRKGVRLDRTPTRSTITATIVMSAPRNEEYKMIIDFYERWFGGDDEIQE